jgi:hypothetical protein
MVAICYKGAEKELFISLFDNPILINLEPVWSIMLISKLSLALKKHSIENRLAVCLTNTTFFILFYILQHHSQSENSIMEDHS